MKGSVLTNKPRTTDDLKGNFRQSITVITVDMFQRVFSSLVCRVPVATTFSTSCGGVMFRRVWGMYLQHLITVDA
jgi:hypothetical protein